MGTGILKLLFLFVFVTTLFNVSAHDDHNSASNEFFSELSSLIESDEAEKHTREENGGDTSDDSQTNFEVLKFNDNLLDAYDKLGLQNPNANPSSNSQTLSPSSNDNNVPKSSTASDWDEVLNDLFGDTTPYADMSKEEEMLEKEMDFEEVEQETEKDVFEVMNEEGESEEAVIVENVEVLTNKDSNETAFLVHDKVLLVNETTNETLYETEYNSEYAIEGKFDKNDQCSEDKPCKFGQYCPKSVGVVATCFDCLNKGDQCQQREQCCGVQTSSSGEDESSSGVCYFGRCWDQVSQGERGTSCMSNYDCKQGHCCRYIAEYDSNFCEQIPTEGEFCLRDDAMVVGTAFIDPLFQGCSPCSQGLQCNPESNTCIPDSSDVEYSDDISWTDYWM